MKRNFVECKTVEEANNMDMATYRFERFSESRDAYIFIARAEAMK